MGNFIFSCSLLSLCVSALYGCNSNSRPLLHVFLTFLYFTYYLTFGIVLCIFICYIMLAYQKYYPVGNLPFWKFSEASQGSFANVATAQKTKFCIRDFFSKCDQICSFLRTWSHLLKKSVMEHFMFLQWVIFE